MFWTNLVFGDDATGAVMFAAQGEVERFAPSHAVNNIAVDDTHVYWTDTHSNASRGRIRRRPTAGSTLELVAVEAVSHIRGDSVRLDAVY